MNAEFWPLILHSLANRRFLGDQIACTRQKVETDGDGETKTCGSTRVPNWAVVGGQNRPQQSDQNYYRPVLVDQADQSVGCVCVSKFGRNNFEPDYH